jgi:hypothetical protein
MFYQRLSESAGVFGHSQGGIGAGAAAGHPNVKSVVVLEGFAAVTAKPAMFITGTMEVTNVLNQAGYKMVTGPTFLGSIKGVEHISTGILNEFTGGKQNDEVSRGRTAWFKCTICGDPNACRLFTGNSCGLCSDPMWAEVKQRNMEKLGQ